MRQSSVELPRGHPRNPSEGAYRDVSSLEQESRGSSDLDHSDHSDHNDHNDHNYNDDNDYNFYGGGGNDFDEYDETQDSHLIDTQLIMKNSTRQLSPSPHLGEALGDARKRDEEQSGDKDAEEGDKEQSGDEDAQEGDEDAQEGDEEQSEDGDAQGRGKVQDDDDRTDLQIPHLKSHMRYNAATSTALEFRIKEAHETIRHIDLVAAAQAVQDLASHASFKSAAVAFASSLTSISAAAAPGLVPTSTTSAEEKFKTLAARTNEAREL